MLTPCFWPAFTPPACDQLSNHLGWRGLDGIQLRTTKAYVAETLCWELALRYAEISSALFINSAFAPRGFFPLMRMHSLVA